MFVLVLGRRGAQLRIVAKHESWKMFTFLSSCPTSCLMWNWTSSAPKKWTKHSCQKEENMKVGGNKIFKQLLSSLKENRRLHILDSSLRTRKVYARWYLTYLYLTVQHFNLFSANSYTSSVSDHNTNLSACQREEPSPRGAPKQLRPAMCSLGKWSVSC